MSPCFSNLAVETRHIVVVTTETCYGSFYPIKRSENKDLAASSFQRIDLSSAKKGNKWIKRDKFLFLLVKTDNHPNGFYACSAEQNNSQIKRNSQELLKSFVKGLRPAVS